MFIPIALIYGLCVFAFGMIVGFSIGMSVRAVCQKCGYDSTPCTGYS